jgi:hypothetical protein
VNFIRRQDAPQIMAQIAERPPLVGRLQAAERRNMHHLDPKGEPAGAGPDIEPFGRKIGLDHRLDTLARRPRFGEAHQQGAADAGEEGAEGRLQQRVLVAEIMQDQRRRDIAARGDANQRGLDIAEFSNRRDGCLDDLPAPDILGRMAGFPSLHDRLHKSAWCYRPGVILGCYHWALVKNKGFIN